MSELTTFASRVPATFIRGEVFDKPLDTDAMLDKANLRGWDVRLRGLDSDARRTKETFEVIRTNPFDGGLDRLGVAGERYGITQIEDVFNMFRALDPRWEAAGSFKNGSVVYGAAHSDRTIVLDPEGAADEIETLIHVSTTFDGSGALRIGRNAQRLDCFNMFNVVFGNLKSEVKVRHTLKVADRMKAIALAWKQNNLYFDRLDAEAHALFEQSATDKEFFAIVDKFMGERPELNTKGAQTKWDNSRELYSQAWKGETNAKAYGTAWGVFNALIERNQWGRTIQNTVNGLDNFAMAGMGFDGPTNTFRQHAWEAAKSLVTV